MRLEKGLRHGVRSGDFLEPLLLSEERLARMRFVDVGDFLHAFGGVLEGTGEIEDKSWQSSLQHQAPCSLVAPVSLRRPTLPIGGP